ncbi:flagellar assembly peptidoglycan hydrolase FlgJ, partial [Pseudomonas sp. MWU13-2860]
NMYGFAQGLQSGGYATDPRYARKLVDVAASLAQQVARI